jgi:hypothetical protein
LLQRDFQVAIVIEVFDNQSANDPVQLSIDADIQLPQELFL